MIISDLFHGCYHYLLPPSKDNPQKRDGLDREKKWFWTGMRPLMAVYIVGVGFVVVMQLHPTPIKEVWVKEKPVKFDARQIELISSARLSSRRGAATGCWQRRCLDKRRAIRPACTLHHPTSVAGADCGSSVPLFVVALDFAVRSRVHLATLHAKLNNE